MLAGTIRLESSEVGISFFEGVHYNFIGISMTLSI